MKKLIPALSLLLISAILVGSSTFAWFSMNTTVKATGLSIKANSDSTFLVIVAGDEFDPTVETTEAEAVADETELYPVMPAVTLDSDNVATPASWQFAYSATPSDFAKEGEYTALSTSLEGYVGSETFTIGLSVDSGVTTSANNIRLTNVDLPDNTGISCVVVYEDVIGTYYTDDTTSLDLGVKATTTGTTVTVYYFINGEDENVYSNNISALIGAVELTFSVEAA